MSDTGHTTEKEAQPALKRYTRTESLVAAVLVLLVLTSARYAIGLDWLDDALLGLFHSVKSIFVR